MTKTTSTPRPQQRYKDAHGALVTIGSITHTRRSTATGITHYAYSRWSVLLRSFGRWRNDGGRPE